MRVDQAEFEKAFNEILDRMKAVRKAKSADYSGDDPLKCFRRFGVNGILVRMDDKMCRLETLTSSVIKQQVKDESIEDTAQDLAVYAILFILARRYLKEDERLEIDRYYDGLDRLRDKITGGEHWQKENKAPKATLSRERAD